MSETIHPCEYHDGAPCQARGYECFNTDNEPAGFFCPDHGFQLGYCMGCGAYWAGIENFEFGGGLCEHCKAEHEANDAEAFSPR